MTAGTRIGHHVQRDRLVDHRADAITDVAAQAEEIEAGFVVDQHRDAHFRLVDVGQLVIQRRGRAGLDAGDVLAHFARNIARIEKWRAGGDRRLRLGEFQRVVGAVAHAQAAADAGAEELILGQRARRAQVKRRQGPGLFGIESKSEAEHADAAGHLGGIENKLATRGAALGGLLFVVAIKNLGLQPAGGAVAPPLSRHSLIARSRWEPNTGNLLH